MLLPLPLFYLRLQLPRLLTRRPLQPALPLFPLRIQPALPLFHLPIQLPLLPTRRPLLPTRRPLPPTRLLPPLFYLRIQLSLLLNRSSPRRHLLMDLDQFSPVFLSTSTRPVPLFAAAASPIPRAPPRVARSAS